MIKVTNLRDRDRDRGQIELGHISIEVMRNKNYFWSQHSDSTRNIFVASRGINHRRMDGRMDRSTDGNKDGRMGGQMDKRTGISFHRVVYRVFI